MEVSRLHLQPNEVRPNEIIYATPSMQAKLGHFGIVRELTQKENSFLATLEFCDAGKGKQELLQFDDRFLSGLPVRRHPGTTFGRDSILRSAFLRERLAELSEFNSRLVPVITELNCLTRLLAIRMSRYLMLMVLRPDISKFAEVVRLFSILILELSYFVPSVSINRKWSHVFGTDIIFPRDSSRLRRKLRALLLTFYKEDSDVFSLFFENPLETLRSDLDLPDSLYKSAPAGAIFESTHPCPKLHIQYTVDDPRAIGFVPIVASNCELPAPGISLPNFFLTGQLDDIRYIPASRFEMTGDISPLSPFHGIALAFIPIRRTLPDDSLKTPAGAVHLIFSLMTLIFSFNATFVNARMCDYLKRQLLPAFLQILKDNGALGTIFAFEFIAPLLSHLEWKSGDLTVATLALIKDYLKRFEDSVSHWQKLSVTAQHAALLKMLFDLTIIDATTRNLAQLPQKPELTITDESIENAKYRHQLSFFYETLNTKLHERPSCVFHKIVDAFTRVAALAHN
jgi:hypothetical protein